MSHRNRGRRASAAVLAGLIASTSIAARAQTAPSPTKAISPAAQISIGAADIGGVVASAHGPEAGVWVIAETTDLPTKFAKIVVTDDAGRYLIPDLPKANYKVWVRGYGLVDSPRVDVTLGQNLDLAATIAPSEAAAAKYYPGMYCGAGAAVVAGGADAGGAPAVPSDLRRVPAPFRLGRQATGRPRRAQANSGRRFRDGAPQQVPQCRFRRRSTAYNNQRRSRCPRCSLRGSPSEPASCPPPAAATDS
jgi:hypothetical protein